MIMDKKIKLKAVGIVHHDLLEKFEEFLKDFNQKNEILVFCDFSEFDIPGGYIFRSIVDGNGNMLYVGEFILKKITQQFARPFDSIPHGWKTISLFQFNEGSIPEVIYQLPYAVDWYQSNNFLYFK